MIIRPAWCTIKEQDPNVLFSHNEIEIYREDFLITFTVRHMHPSTFINEYFTGLDAYRLPNINIKEIVKVIETRDINTVIKENNYKFRTKLWDLSYLKVSLNKRLKYTAPNVKVEYDFGYAIPLFNSMTYKVLETGLRNPIVIFPKFPNNNYEFKHRFL